MLSGNSHLQKAEAAAGDYINGSIDTGIHSAKLAITNSGDVIATGITSNEWKYYKINKDTLSVDLSAVLIDKSGTSPNDHYLTNMVIKPYATNDIYILGELVNASNIYKAQTSQGSFDNLYTCNYYLQQHPISVEFLSGDTVIFGNYYDATSYYPFYKKLSVNASNCVVINQCAAIKVTDSLKTSETTALLLVSDGGSNGTISRLYNYDYTSNSVSLLNEYNAVFNKIIKRPNNTIVLLGSSPSFQIVGGVTGNWTHSGVDITQATLLNDGRILMVGSNKWQILNTDNTFGQSGLVDSGYNPTSVVVLPDKSAFIMVDAAGSLRKVTLNNLPVITSTSPSANQSFD